ncbi:WDR59 [Lepeophtheirus salmonis]|nr:WDR59 [Lepeophtheirus salmonis]CAF2881458.1 WDR59 [Lepeophtheirus salmonis]
MWDVRRRKNNSKSECSVDTGRDIALDILSSSSNIKHSRSNSDTQSLDDYAKSFADSLKSSLNEDHRKEKVLDKKKDLMLLDPSKNKLYDDVKGAYAELLLRMGLNSKATQVRKRRSSMAIQDTSSYIVFTTRQCPSCLRTIRGGSCCRYCNDGGSVSSCSLCQLPCRGVTSVCIYCNHGGHLGHIVEWFRTHDQCPTGCGCRCVARE